MPPESVESDPVRLWVSSKALHTRLGDNNCVARMLTYGGYAKLWVRYPVHKTRLGSEGGRTRNSRPFWAT